MWFRKKASYLECTRCGCSTWRARKVVKVEESGVWEDGSFLPYFGPHSSTELYCGRCAPPYNVRCVKGSGTHYYRREDIEVTEKGKPIKEKSTGGE